MATLVSNRQATFQYEILETLDAGIELFGFEVKALKSGQAALKGSHVLIRGNEAFLSGATITPLQPKNVPPTYDPLRVRKLLLTKKEIEKLQNASETQGLTIAPLEVYNNSRWIKVKLAIVRGKKRFDKRETIKRRESDRDIQRTLKNEY